MVDEKQEKKIVIRNDSEWIGVSIERSFQEMWEEGEIDEVREIMEIDIDNEIKEMKEIGVREVSEFIEEKMQREEDIES